MIRLLLVSVALVVSTSVKEPEGAWTKISTEGAPAARSDSTAVWTGKEVLVWGGADDSGYKATGFAYNPKTDSWRTLSKRGAPAARAWHTAVWSGNEMIVWGGVGKADGERNDGGAYDPVQDKWRTLTTENAPTARGSHLAVWAGDVMFIWAGVDDSHAFPTAAAYDPVENSWMALLVAQLDKTPRSLPGVWTGSEVMAFGGINGSFAVGEGMRWEKGERRYSRKLPKRGAPLARSRHSAVWTGTEFVVWGGAKTALGGGALANGARLEPQSDRWLPMPELDGPSARFEHGAVWTGDEMWIVGGANEVNGAGLRDVHAWQPEKGWRAIEPLPEGRADMFVFHTEFGVVVLGGRDGDQAQSGGFVRSAKTE